jgi:CRP/FNR family transcriptional regulator, dissimilatory nitrate respiration regulator
MIDEFFYILLKIRLFENMTGEELHKLFDCLKPKKETYTKNSCIVNEGEDLKGIGIILSGAASVVKEGIPGNRMIMTKLMPGDLFGEIAAFSKNPKWPATVISQEESEVIFLSSDKFTIACENTCSWHRSLIQNMLIIISEKAMMLNRKVEYLAIKSMRGKISRFLLEQYKKTGSKNFILPMSRIELADFLNVSRPSMSREMARMKDKGIIDFYMAAIQIKDIEALRGMIE